MPYAVQADLVPRRLTQNVLIQLTDDASSGEANAQIVTDVLLEASATIDSYARLRYAIPLKQSDQVKGLCLDIAVYLLYSRRARMAETVQKRYDDAISFLKDIAVGKAALDQPAAATPQTGGGGSLATSKEEKFSDDNLAGFI
jgi:phage gp36-like protein